MKVVVSGLVTSVQYEVKNEKPHTTVLLAQKGQKQQVTVRLPGHVDEAAGYELTNQEFEGRVMMWSLRDGSVGSMVMVDSE